MSYPPPNYGHGHPQYTQPPPPQGYPAGPYPPSSYPAPGPGPSHGHPIPAPYGHSGGSPAPPGSAGGYPSPASHPSQSPYQPPPGPYQQYPPQPGHPAQPPYQQGHPAPYGQAPPPWGAAPPPGQYGTPPPPHAAPYPPQGAYPPQGYPQGYPPGPPPGAYGAPGGYPPAAPVPAPPSLGYDPDQRASGDASKEADALRKAMKGWGTDEKMLIDVLAKPDPLVMSLIRHTYMNKHGRNLEKDLKSELSGDFEIIMLSLAAGPLGQDIAYLRDAMSGIGTDETAINDVLIGRSNADLRAIKYGYVQRYNKALVDDIKSDLSGKTEKFFLMLLNAARPERGTYFDQASVDKDVHELHLATNAKTGTDELSVAAVFLAASDQKLAAVSQAFEAKYHISLEKTIKDEFSGHLEKALLAILARSKDPLKFDVETMLHIVPPGGAKADIKRLIYWAVRLHWNPPYLVQVKEALQVRTGSDFGRRIRGALPSGDLAEAVLRVWS
ncbi:annexin [Aspergillus mulundensis]|uniref:Annexin n=1 Tax=Aspergillus mulundensis TaxID=1810919 RepID=A0A3D8S5R5_9EURO|nr:Annexin [Aspergillus mulundensis]RDW81596.1 Annexin [Aspergillus mulundensis]